MDAYADERAESLTARQTMSEWDRAPGHPHAHLGICGDRDDARSEVPRA